MSSWAFAPWRHDAARTAAAWLGEHAPAPFDVIRADLSAAAPRARPVPPIDAAVRASFSLPDAATPGPPAGPPRSWTAIETYAESAHRAVVAWRSGGTTWDLGYSGPIGLVDHVLLAVLREQDVVSRWVAHIDDLPTHLESGARDDDSVVEGGLLTAAERILAGAGFPIPQRGRVTELVLAVIAARADEIVVTGQGLVDALLATPAWAPHRSVLAPRLQVWTPPADTGSVAGLALPDAVPAGDSVPAGPAGSGAGPGPLRIAGWVPGSRAPAVLPLLSALGLLEPEERAGVSLQVASDDPAALTPALRDLGLEEKVVVGADFGGPADIALVVDRPVPDGLGWSPRVLPELGEWAALGVPVILVAPQDSPLTSAPAAHHLPTDHVSAARALLATLANSRSLQPAGRLPEVSAPADS